MLWLAGPESCVRSESWERDQYQRKQHELRLGRDGFQEDQVPFSQEEGADAGQAESLWNLDWILVEEPRGTPRRWRSEVY